MFPCSFRMGSQNQFPWWSLSRQSDTDPPRQSLLRYILLVHAVALPHPPPRAFIWRIACSSTNCDPGQDVIGGGTDVINLPSGRIANLEDLFFPFCPFSPLWTKETVNSARVPNTKIP